MHHHHHHDGSRPLHHVVERRWVIRDLRLRIFAAIGAGGAASLGCGAKTGLLVPETTDVATPADASAPETQLDSSSSDTDALAEDAVDGSSDACGTTGIPCKTASDCCPGLECRLGTCRETIRRPFLVGSSLRSAAVAARDDWHLGGASPPPNLDSTTTRALASEWLRDALEEHASIAAFARFTLHLLSVGAPPGLILASQSAARDEVRHARACFALAKRYGGRDVGPAALSLEGVLPPMSLAEIAALTAEEGCVGETLGALLAERQLATTTDPWVRDVLTRAHLVADECRHAELAWSFVSWAVVHGDERVERAVHEAISRAVRTTLAMPLRRYDGIDLGAWRAHGRLTCAEARTLVERGVREVIAPAAALLRRRRAETLRDAHEDANPFQGRDC